MEKRLCLQLMSGAPPGARWLAQAAEAQKVVRVVLPELAASASACRTEGLVEPHFSGLPMRSARRASKAMLLPWRAWLAAGFFADTLIEPPTGKSS